MKKSILTIIAIIFSYFGFSQSSDEIEITKLEAIVTNAFLKSDTVTLKGLWDSNYVVRSPYNKIAGIKQLFAVFANPNATHVRFETVIEKITINQNVAIVMGRDTPDEKSLNSGLPKEILTPRVFTNIWVKRNGKWLQIARQVTHICQ